MMNTLSPTLCNRAVLMAALLAPAALAHAQKPAAVENTAPSVRPTIVLVHGAFADGTGW